MMNFGRSGKPSLQPSPNKERGRDGADNPFSRREKVDAQDARPDEGLRRDSANDHLA